MRVKDLKKGDILFSVPIYIGKINDSGKKFDISSEQALILETYEVLALCRQLDGTIQVITNPIIGCDDPYISLPADYDLNNLIICYYNVECTWGWTSNEDLALQWFKRVLNVTFFTELEFYIEEYYDIWKNCWKNDIKTLFE